MTLILPFTRRHTQHLGFTVSMMQGVNAPRVECLHPLSRCVYGPFLCRVVLLERTQRADAVLVCEQHHQHSDADLHEEDHQGGHATSSSSSGGPASYH